MPENGNRLTPKLRFREFQERKGWEETTLGAIAAFHKGRGISKAEVDANGSRPCIRYGELYTRYGEVIDRVLSRTHAPADGLFLSRKNDVIIPASGETKLDIAKASCVMLDGVALGSDLNVIRTNHNGVFLTYYLNSAKKLDIASVAQGDSVVHLYPTQLESLSIELPEKDEQQKIADCLMSVDEVIAAQGRKVAALEAYKKGLTQRLFPRGGNAVPRFRFPEFADAPAWETKTLSAIAENLDNKRVPISESNRTKGDVPYYGASGIVDYVKDYLFDEDLLCISEDGANLVTRTYPIVFAISGKTWVNNHAHVLRFENPSTQKIVEDYLNSIDLRDFITGMAQPKLNRAMLDRIPIPLPGAREQERIAGCLCSLDDAIAAESGKLDSFNTHKKGLTQQLFPSLERMEV